MSNILQHNPLTNAGVFDEVKKLKGDKSWQQFDVECINANFPASKLFKKALTEEVAYADLLVEATKLKGDNGWLKFALEAIAAKYPKSTVIAQALKEATTTAAPKPDKKADAADKNATMEAGSKIHKAIDKAAGKPQGNAKGRKAPPKKTAEKGDTMPPRTEELDELNDIK